jgi:uncharacterized membrane protein YqiK
MYFLLAFICGAIAGAIVSVIIYRRNTAKIEEALADAVILRDKARAEAEALKKKVGG